ncbi:MAG: TIGR04149 family rSAM-modified RiPP [Bacteroidetes bacterium]|nr:TIGR04149 family rSAM-modified RiPP [Bacteroidota bacterium]
MKKLKSLKLDALKEVLTKEQMKKITGGYYCPTQLCSFNYQCCPTWHCCNLSGRCAAPGTC